MRARAGVRARRDRHTGVGGGSLFHKRNRHGWGGGGVLPVEERERERERDLYFTRNRDRVRRTWVLTCG